MQSHTMFGSSASEVTGTHSAVLPLSWARCLRCAREEGRGMARTARYNGRAVAILRAIICKLGVSIQKIALELC